MLAVWRVELHVIPAVRLMEAQGFDPLRLCFVPEFRRPKFGTVNPERETKRGRFFFGNQYPTRCFAIVYNSSLGRGTGIAIGGSSNQSTL